MKDNGINPYQGLGLSINASNKTAVRSDKLGQDQFLELMITQLRNQDPLKPMENGEFLGQMAQFGTVSGIQDLQNSVNQLVNSLQSNQALQASALVGRSVLISGNQGVLAQGGSVDGVVELPASTTALTINLSDASGQQVRTLTMGPQAAGDVIFSWDGLDDSGQPVSPGTYSFSAEALLGGQVTAVETSATATVESVSLGQGGQGIVLNLTGLGPTPLSAVKQIM